MKENERIHRAPATLDGECPSCFGIPEMVCPRDDEGVIQPQPECLQCKAVKSCLRKAVEVQGLIREREPTSPIVFRVTGFLKRWSEHKRHGGPLSILENEALTTNRIVVVHQGALGDFLLVLSVLKGLHDGRPALRFHFWTRPQYAQLLRELPFLGGFHTCEGSELTPYYHDDLWRTADVPVFFQDADTTLFFGQSSARPVCERLSQRLPYPVHWIQSFPSPQEHSRKGVPELVADQLRALGYSAPSTVMRLQAVPEAGQFVRQLLQELGWEKGARPVLLHVGSGGKKKIWPLRRWRLLMRWLRE